MLIDNKELCMGCMKMLPPGKTKCDCGFDEEIYEKTPYSLAPGTILNESIVVGRVIGEGGFGITYIAYNLDLDLRVAVKEFYMKNLVGRNTDVSNVVYSSTKDIEEKFRVYKDKFINEAKTLAKFNDEPGVVSVLNYFRENNTAYIVMEYVDGQNLKNYIKEKGVMTPKEVVKKFDPVFDALISMHKNKIIHRDISPDNIMITKDGKVKLLDFGAARKKEDDGSNSFTAIAKLGYTPYEQYGSHGNQGPWTDVYALCATMYTCITGDVPESSIDRMTKADEDSLPANFCEEPMMSIIKKGMASYVDDRYASIEELRSDLKPYLQENEEKKSNATVLIAVCAAVVILALLIIFFVRKNSPSEDEITAVEQENAVTNVPEIPRVTEQPKQSPAEEALPEAEEPSEIIVDYEVAYIEFSHNKTEEEIDKALEVVKDRLDFSFGKDGYELEEAEDYCKLVVPVDNLQGEDPSTLIDTAVIMPGNIFVNYGTGNGNWFICSIDKDEVLSAEVQNGIVEGIDLSGRSDYDGGDYDYIKLELADSAIKEIDKMLKIEIESEVEPVIRLTLDNDEAKHRFSYVSIYVYYDRAAKSLYFTDLNMGRKTKELLAYNFTHDAFDCEFESYVLKPVYWEREEQLNRDEYLDKGEYQVDPEFFADNNIKAVDVVYESTFSSSFGEWIDCRKVIQDRLDLAGINYSLGIPNYDEYSLVVRLPAEGTGEVYYRALGESYSSVVYFNTYNKCYYKEESLSDLKDFIDSVEFDDNHIRINLSDRPSEKDYNFKNYDAGLELAAAYDNKVAWELNSSNSARTYFFGKLNQEDKYITFDATTLSDDGKIKEGLTELSKLLNAIVCNKDIVHYNFSSYSVVADSYGEIEQLEGILLYDRVFDISEEKKKEILTYSVGAEPEINISSYSITMKFKQNISESFAENVCRIVSGVFSSDIFNESGVFQVPPDMNIRFIDSNNRNMVTLFIDLSKVSDNGKYTVEVYKYDIELSEENQKLRDMEINELVKLLKKDNYIYDVIY